MMWAKNHDPTAPGISTIANAVSQSLAEMASVIIWKGCEELKGVA
jgi:hypothetical protein